MGTKTGRNPAPGLRGRRTRDTERGGHSGSRQRHPARWALRTPSGYMRLAPRGQDCRALALTLSPSRRRGGFQIGAQTADEFLRGGARGTGKVQYVVFRDLGGNAVEDPYAGVDQRLDVEERRPTVSRYTN